MINLIKKHKLKAFLLGFLLILDLFVIALAIIPSNKDVIAPGGLNKVESVINVDNDEEIKGTFNTIYVYSIERVSLLQAFIASLNGENEIFDSPENINLSREETIMSGSIQKNQSIEASLICVYNEANKYDQSIKLDYEFMGFIVYSKTVTHNLFEIGDIITKINGVKILDKESLSNSIKGLKQNDTISYLKEAGVNNEGEKIYTEVNYTFNNDLKGGFAVYEKYKLDKNNANPKYMLFDPKTSGPSGGLMQTLYVYSKVFGKDLTYGKKIAGTGSIDINGNVGEIGGISQKVITAFRNNADCFICPMDNSKEGYATYKSIKGHEKMDFIIVKTLSDAISELGRLYEN